MPSCTGCGKEVSRTDTFCSNCGTELSIPQTTPTTNGAGYHDDIESTIDQRNQPAKGGQEISTAELNTDVLGRRIIAVVVDSVIVMFILGIFLGVLNIQGVGGLFLGYLTLYPAYFAVAEARSGHTPGKSILDLEVVSQNGRPITSIQAVVRNIIRPVDGFFHYLVGVLIIAASDRNQRLGDHVANTLVIKAE